MTLTSASDQPAVETPAPEPRVRGAAIVHRFYDVGYAIRLEQAFDRLASSAPERPRPVRGEGRAILIPHPPVTVGLGAEQVTLAGAPHAVEWSARLFDFGVLSLRARVEAPPDLSWGGFAAFGAAASGDPGWNARFAAVGGGRAGRGGAARVKPAHARVVEDYVVFRVDGLRDAAGVPLPADVLRDDDIARLLLGETRPLAPAARRDMLSPRFSYFEDDLAVLTWNTALVVEPVPEDTDVQYVLEFANAQLLELRYYDSILEDELPAIDSRIAEARRGFHLLGRRFSHLLASLQERVADATELVERVENALKVTDDVFLARIYASALEIFRGRTWRSGIDRKIAIIRDSYSMLNAESGARRSEALELVIVALILLEIVLGLARR